MKITDGLLLLLLAAIWGSSFMFMRATSADFGPVFLVTIRVGVAALCLVGVLLAATRWQEFSRHWRILIWVGLLNSALPFMLLTYATLSLSAGFVSVINATVPIFTAVIAFFWLRIPLNRWQLIGLMISVAGTLILIWDTFSMQSSQWQAVLAGFAAMVCYGTAINGTKKYLADMSPMVATAGSMLFSGVFVSVVGLFFLPDFSKLTVQGWSYAIALAVLCTAFAYVIFFRLIHNIGPTAASSVTFLAPIFAFLWAYLFLGERLTWRMVIATAVILIGTTLLLKIFRPGSS